MRLKLQLFFVAIIAFLLGAFFLPISTKLEVPQESFATETAPKTDEEKQTIDVYKQTNAAVVFISTISLSIDPYDLFPQLKPNQGSGSGIIIDSKQGIILTNSHVVSNAQKIEVTLVNSQTIPARLVGKDLRTDLAVLQLTEIPKNLSSVKLGKSNDLEIGQRVLAIGNPFGLHRTLTAGIISSLNRTLKTDNDRYLHNLIQTDAAINPGNSGGPLLDMSGNLIGINTVILSQSGDSAGIGFAIAIDAITEILPELIATGKVERPEVGWVLAETNRGVVIRRIFRDSPAAKAELNSLERYVNRGFFQSYYLDYNVADFLVSINGETITSKLQVDKIFNRLDPGESLQLVLRSGGQERTVNLTPVWQ